MIEFTLPSLGADMDEGTLLEWRVRPGDAVKRGQVVAVVDTAKAAIDVECWHEGTVDTLAVATGAKIPVGTVLALLRAPGESDAQAALWKASRPSVPAAPPAAAALLAAVPVAPPGQIAAVQATGRRRISPVARRRAEELHIDIATVSGSGPDHAISVEDIERAAAQSREPPAAGRAEQMRRTIAAAMARSKREIPHYYLAEEVPLERATQWLQARNAAQPVTSRLLMAALFIAASAKALRAFPELNGYFRNDRFEPASGVHLGIAIALREGGLIAPALLDADTKPLEQIMREMTDLVRRARAYSLRSSELASATATLTSLGDTGTLSVFGVIYPPQVALIGCGAVTERAVAQAGQVRAIPAVTFSLSADHRASDGHRGARLLAAIGASLQQPERL